MRMTASIPAQSQRLFQVSALADYSSCGGASVTTMRNTLQSEIKGS
jgi:hypothetical protein